MPLSGIDDLNSMQVDVLKELGSIGVGNAVTALSSLIGKKIGINVPTVRIMGFNDSVNFLGGPEEIVAGLLINLSRDINGMILYIFEDEFASVILKDFFGKDLICVSDMDDMDKSAISEVGNIMAGSYVRAICTMTGLAVNLSVPSLCIDMAGAILSVPAIEFAKIGNKVLFVDDSFSIGSKTVKSNMILVPEMNSLNLLFNKLGVGT